MQINNLNNFQINNLSFKEKNFCKKSIKLNHDEKIMLKNFCTAIDKHKNEWGLRDFNYNIRQSIDGFLSLNFVCKAILKSQKILTPHLTSIYRERSEEVENVCFDYLRNKDNSHEILFLCKEMIAQGTHAIAPLLRHFDTLGLKEKTKDVALELCHEILLQGNEDMVGEIVSSFRALKLEQVNPVERFDLLKKIAEKSAFLLGNNLRPIFFQDFEKKQIYELCELILSQGDRAAAYFANNFENSGLKFHLSEELRLNLAKKIACSGPKSGATLAMRFNYFEIKFINAKDKLQFCTDIALQGEEAAENLIRYNPFQLHKAPLEQRLDLCYKILLKIKGKGAQAIACNAKELGLDHAPLQERLKLCHMIISCGADSAGSLASNIKDWKLNEATVEERFDLCKKILSFKEGGSTSNVASCLPHFDLKGMDKKNLFELYLEIISSESISSTIQFARNLPLLSLEIFSHSERLQLYRSILSKGDFPGLELAKNIDFLHLEGTEEDRFGFILELAATGEKTSQQLLWSLEKLNLNKVSLKMRLALCETIAKQGKLARRFLCRSFAAFQLEKAQLEERLTLCKLILSQRDNGDDLLEHLKNIPLNLGELAEEEMLDLLKQAAPQSQEAARYLFENIKTMLPLSLSQNLSSLFRICKEIALSGDLAACCFVLNFKQLGFEKIPSQERIALTRLIASQGVYAARSLASNLSYSGFALFGLTEATPQERLALCKEIANQGNSALDALAKSFGEFQLSQEDTFCFITHCCQLGLQESFASNQKILHQWMGYFNGDALKRQIYFELIAPPSELKYFEYVPGKAIESIYPLLKFKNERDKIEEMIDFISKNEKLKVLFPIIEKIKQEHNFHQPDLFDWIAYAAAHLYDLELDQIKKIERSGFLQLISLHKNPINRYRLMRLLPQHLQHLPEESESSKQKNSWISLSELLLAPLKNAGLNSQLNAKFLEKIAHKGFKDLKKFDCVIQYFLDIHLLGKLKKEEADYFVQAAINALDKKPLKKLKKGTGNCKSLIDQITEEFDLLTNFLKIFGEQAFYHMLEHKKVPREEFQSQFKILFSLSDLEDLNEKYQKTFGLFRNPMALFTYLRSLIKLSKSDKEKTLKVLNQYVRSVLTGEFHKERYDEEKNVHLKKVFASKGLRELWISSMREEQPVFLSGQVEEEKKEYQNFFKTKIILDKHLEPEKLPRLINFLEHRSENIQPSEHPLECFQNLAIQLCLKQITVVDFVKKVKELEGISNDFINDLKVLTQNQVKAKLSISISDNPCNLLLMGTESNGSCLRVNGEPNKTKSLLSLLMHGEILAIVLNTEDEKIAARSLLRLMWDEKNKTNVILLERVYSNLNDPSITAAIIQVATDLAKIMGIPLVSKEVVKGGETLYQGNVSFLGGGYAPYIYSDACGGVLEGPFEAKDCYILYNPTICFN